MNEVLLGSVIDKVDAQERKIGVQENQINELKGKAENIFACTEIVSQIKTAVEGLRTDVKKISFPEKEMRELSATLKTSMMLLKEPMKKEIIHHHHATKTIWIAAGLFLMVCLASTGWYNTHNNLEMYKANDTKYRYLKLEATAGLRKWLGIIDSLYLTNTKMRTEVLAKEEQNIRNLEMMQKALEMENGAKKLKQKVNGKGKKKQIEIDKKRWLCSSFVLDF